ncbi:MAG TPA: hypothetical protein VFD92_23835 [Candidatus Binatia bacterium]|nr:hypothetical protein [Candidatus Binatia bacterium]
MRSVFKLAVAAVAVFGFTSSAFAQVALPLDEYLCYQAKEMKVPPNAQKFKDLAVTVNMKDQFDVVRGNGVAKYVSLCNPITAGRSCAGAALNPSVHLAEYQTKDLKTAAKFVAPATIYNLADCIGARSGVTINKPKSLMVASGKNDYGPLTKCKVNGDCSGGDTCQSGLCLPPGLPVPSAPTIGGNVQDYACYSIKGPKGPFGNVGPVSDQFGYTESYLMNKITKVCAPTGVTSTSGTPTTPGASGHLICYQAKSLKTNAVKFVAHEVAISNSLDAARYLDAKKVTDLCMPALKSATGTPTFNTPTTLTTISQDAGGVCGALTTNGAASEGVPGRRNPSDALTSPNDCCTGSAAGTCNSVCTGVATPLLCCTGAGTGSCNACCTGADAGHCNEGKTVTCGSLTFGGGGPSVGSPGSEGADNFGDRSRYTLTCSGPGDTACPISGNAGDIPNAVNCTTTGCGGVTPIDTTSPVKVCALNTLGAPASGSLNLATGDISLSTTTNATVYILTATSYTTQACPRCRTTTATTSPVVFASGGMTGAGVCDNDAANSGASCFVFEQSGSTAGLSTDCIPDVSGGGSGVISIATTSTTAGTSVADAAGHFCPGQGGNSDCTGAGTPNVCCSGAGMGSCNNFNGCFGSANSGGAKFADTPATCTGISSTGSNTGLLIAGSANDPVATYGTVGCIPGVAAGAVLSGLVNNNAGLPGPVVVSSKVAFDIN